MLDLKPATFEEFEREAERGNVVPVVRSVLADLQTPVGAFLRLADNAQYASPKEIQSIAKAQRRRTPT